MQEKILSEGLTFHDFLEQIQHIQKMGPLEQILGLMPGMGKAMKGIELKGNELKKVEAVILSMTDEEKRKPHIIDGSRRRRIAYGSGTSVQDVNNLMKQFFTMQKMMKKVSKFGAMKSMRGMKLPF